MQFRTAVATLGSATLLQVACATAQTDFDPGPSVSAAEDSMAVATIRGAAIPLSGAEADYDRLVAMIRDAQVVLLGEATHGTHEFYRERARITRRLIEQHGFTAVAVEGDWPEVYPVNRYVRGAGISVTEALAGFEDFPEWMWRNTDVVELIEWMRSYNQSRSAEARVGFYGLDMQTLGPALTAVTDYLGRADPRAAERARARFRCFGRYRDDPSAYAQSVEYGAATSCERQVAEQLREFEGPLAALGSGSAPDAREEFFAAAQNARLISSSEAYFRAMYRRNVSTWNMRDRYMHATLERLVGHMGTPQRPARIVVWAHNSHIGDARASHMGEQGELNLGQLARERWGTGAVLVGFSTYSGTVMAASDWGGDPERKTVRPALPGSYPDLFHRTGLDSFLLIIRNEPVRDALSDPRLQRDIGVIYLPQSERASHYSHTRMADQFDAVIHIDETRGVQPLESRRRGASDPTPSAAGPIADGG